LDAGLLAENLLAGSGRVRRLASVMPTAVRRKPVRVRKAPRKAVAARRAKEAAFVLSEAEIERINGAQESWG